MQIEYRKKFLKELSKLPSHYSSQIEEFVFIILPTSKNLEEIGRVEKMTGYNNYFKIRFGNYRIGLKKNNKSIIIETVKHRKEIYRFFP